MRRRYLLTGSLARRTEPLPKSHEHALDYVESMREDIAKESVPSEYRRRKGVKIRQYVCARPHGPYASVKALQRHHER